ncbi:MAG: metalloregulator ArsR/SmtB family transcription factor [Bacteroidia bacterium]
MPAAKTEKFTEDQNRLARLAKALGHPARVAILELLSTKGACVCGSIVDELPLSQATVSQHLKAMKEAGLIRGEVEGTNVCYCLDVEACGKALMSMQKLFFQTGCC